MLFALNFHEFFAHNVKICAKFNCKKIHWCLISILNTTPLYWGRRFFVDTLYITRWERRQFQSCVTMPRKSKRRPPDVASTLCSLSLCGQRSSVRRRHDTMQSVRILDFLADDVTFRCRRCTCEFKAMTITQGCQRMLPLAQCPMCYVKWRLC